MAIVATPSTTSRSARFTSLLNVSQCFITGGVVVRERLAWASVGGDQPFSDALNLLGCPVTPRALIKIWMKWLGQDPFPVPRTNGVWLAVQCLGHIRNVKSLFTHV